nr:hypothetical protein [Tanacetum cinerariifolium]
MPLLEEKRSHCQKDRTAINDKKKLPVKDGSYAKVVITLEDPIINSFQQVVSELDTTDTTDTTTTTTTSGETGTKSGRTVTLTAEDMQKKKNDVKARTTLLLSLPDEHQLRFSKYKTTQELWVAILKIFSVNEATKKTKKNLLKQQYGNFRAEGSETLEQTAPRSQDRGTRDNFRQGSKAEEHAPKSLMAIDGVRWDWSYMVNNGEDHALVADEEAPTEFSLMAN